MTIDAAIESYDRNYDTVGEWILHRDAPKVYLGLKDDKYCRFCNRQGNIIDFKKKAHAIPESLGNKTLFSHYECDDCNAYFGETIETDFGAWSKPMRTMCRISGKSGVPSLRLDQEGIARIDVKNGGLVIQDYEHDPKHKIDTNSNTITFELKRDTYTPIAVFKAFVKFGLTLMPAEAMESFKETLKWIRHPDHSKTLVSQCPLFWTFISGPMPNDRIKLQAFVRKTGITDMPFAFYTLAYGNEMYQVFLPSPSQDSALEGKEMKIIAYPNPVQRKQVPDYRFGITNLDLMNKERVVGDIATIGMHFDRIEESDLSK